MILSKIASIITNISNVQGQPTLVNDSVQIALNRFYQFHDWPYYLVDAGIIKTVADYNTGTIAINNASSTATITTGVVSSNFVSRKLRVGSDKPWYRIISVNTVGNTVTLDAPYQGTSVTASTYEIYQDEYKLMSDVDKYKMLRQFQNGIPMLDVTPTRLDTQYPTPQNYADPVMNAMIGSVDEEYSVGTISGSANTITGVGTGWTSVLADGIGRLSLIKNNSNNNVYTIKSVDSDTQITTYESVGTIAAGTSYTILLNNLQVQVYQIPNAQRVLRYRYFRIPNPLVNSWDVPDMPHEYHDLLIYGGLSMILSQKGDINKAFQTYEQMFLNGMQQAKIKIGSFAPDRITKRRSTDFGSRTRRLDGLEASHFDRRYSL